MSHNLENLRIALAAFGDAVRDALRERQPEPFSICGVGMIHVAIIGLAICADLSVPQEPSIFRLCVLAIGALSTSQVMAGFLSWWFREVDSK